MLFDSQNLWLLLWLNGTSAGFQILQEKNLPQQQLPQGVLAVLTAVLLVEGDGAPRQFVGQKVGGEDAGPDTSPAGPGTGHMLDAAAAAHWAAWAARNVDSPVTGLSIRTRTQNSTGNFENTEFTR